MEGIREVLSVPLQGEQAVSAVQQGIAAMSRVGLPPLPAEARSSGFYKIFNIFDEYHLEQLPTGSYFIPACEYGFEWEFIGKSPSGEEIYERREAPKGAISFSRPLLIPKVVYYGIRKEIEVVDWRQESGRAVCADILGLPQSHPMIGIPNGLGYKSKSQDLTEWGCFLAVGDEPTEQELKAAQKMLIAKMRKFRADGDSIHRKGPLHTDDISDSMRKADAFLVQNGLASPAAWNTETSSIMCPGCGDPVNPGIAFHRLCGAVVNQEVFDKLKWAPDSAGAKARK